MSTSPSGVSPLGVPRMDRRAWGVRLVLCGAIFLEGIDVAMLNVALPSIRSEMDLTTGQLEGAPPVRA
ncbi:hypothetical protein GCM10010329_32050 [Streptomyces spiroverticillatus]|uniref:MFS transporter n=1 Tax=Streptomyces finlayi TaxID=67296 RepID=A0A918WWA4_9ACTN|nr:hypothetical protein GCM10010329_32050 [Streptomyces spiroverticillatus]GHC90452.1 hypothetical protein GCM10010334_24460 [Streptomyces finlayi]